MENPRLKKFAQFVRAFFVVPVDPVTLLPAGQPHSFTVITDDDQEKFLNKLDKAVMFSLLIGDDGCIHQLQLFADDTRALEEYIELDGYVELPVIPDSNS